MRRIEEGDPEKLISNKYPPASVGGGSPFLNFQAKGILGFLDNMRSKMKDSRYKFLFEPGDYSPELGISEKSRIVIFPVFPSHNFKRSFNPFLVLPSKSGRRTA